jgi:hypothetical protein
MDEMSPGVSSRDLDACRMPNEAPADDEVAARVRAAIVGDFQPEHVNGFTMSPDEGSIDLVSLSLPLLEFLFFRLFSGLTSVFIRLDRRSVLEASGKGGRRRS